MANKFPSWKQALFTFIGGIVLAISSCLGFAVTLDGNDSLSTIMAGAFIGSLVMILVGFVFTIMCVIRAMMEKGTPTNRPEGPPA